MHILTSNQLNYKLNLQIKIINLYKWYISVIVNLIFIIILYKKNQCIGILLQENVITLSVDFY